MKTTHGRTRRKAIWFRFRKRLAERFGVGGEALYVVVACALTLSVSELAAYEVPMMQKETP